MFGNTAQVIACWQAGEVANRILSVGSAKRAMLLSEMLLPLDNARQLLEVESDRGFLTITGDPFVQA